MTAAPRGLSLVVAYKLGKAAIELLAVGVALILHSAVGADAGALAARIERHYLHGFGAVLASLMHALGNAGDARLVVVALSAVMRPAGSHPACCMARCTWAASPTSPTLIGSAAFAAASVVRPAAETEAAM